MITTGNAGTCLANELPGDAVRLDLDFPNMYHQPSPKPQHKWPNGQVWLGQKYTHHDKRPLGHGTLLTGNSPRAFKQHRRPSRCVPPIFLSALFPLHDFSKRQGTRRTLVEGVTSDGGTEGKSANDVGPGRTSGDGGECPGCKTKVGGDVLARRSLPGDNRWGDLPEVREAVRRPRELSESVGVHERMDEGHTLSERVGEHGCVDFFENVQMEMRNKRLGGFEMGN